MIFIIYIIIYLYFAVPRFFSTYFSQCLCSLVLILPSTFVLSYLWFPVPLGLTSILHLVFTQYLPTTYMDVHLVLGDYFPGM